jgi:hypothetical protein
MLIGKCASILISFITFNWKIEILWRRKKIKIKVEDLTLIFGKRKQEALALLKKGFQRNPEEDKMYRWGQ